MASSLLKSDHMSTAYQELCIYISQKLPQPWEVVSSLPTPQNCGSHGVGVCQEPGTGPKVYVQAFKTPTCKVKESNTRDKRKLKADLSEVLLSWLQTPEALAHPHSRSSNTGRDYFGRGNSWEGAQREASEVLVTFYTLTGVGITQVSSLCLKTKNRALH